MIEPADPAVDGPVDPFADIAAIAAMPRVTGLTLSLDGHRLVATVQQPDAKGARYVSALWEVPLAGGEPVRLTRSEQGETAPAFAPDGSLLFLSARPVGGGDSADGDGAALWQLPPHGEPRRIAHRPGGLGAPAVAAGSGAVIVSGSRLARSTDADDAERRTTRTDRKISAILHTGMPIRFWDHELGDVSPRLLHLAGPDADLTDLAPDADTELIEAAYSVSADGATVATHWRQRRPRGRTPYAVAVIDVASGKRTMLADDDGWQFSLPRVSPDGALIALGGERDATFETTPYGGLLIFAVAGGAPVQADTDDCYPTEWAWSPDSRTVYASGDLHGNGAVLAIDARTGAVVRRLACDGAYSALCPSPDGRYLYALRSGIAEAPRPVRLDTAAEDQKPELLPSPAPTPQVRGRLEELWVEVDGAQVHAWLCLPPESDTPAPLMQWIHGGPFLSYNSWTWRWVPWLAVARGWAVLMPDPALSTGYGEQFLQRAWPYRAAVVWRDIEAVLDTVVARPDIDQTRTACLGASFGGFMTNWVAGHTDRFGAIVTHAGLWALDQQHSTTDAAQFKTGIFGYLNEHPQWHAENSPHNSVDRIVTPMLITHGNRDYRVPFSEALRLWWELVSRHDGPAESMPHRFLQLTGENHWVLSPGNAEVWWDAVLGFCGEHVLGEPWTPSPLL